MKGFREHWDRLVVYLLLVLYGGYSIGYPIVSLQRAAPHWAEIMLGAEFVIAGILLALGLSPRRRGYRMLGLVVIALGLLTISLVIALSGGMRVLAYAFLFGAFAMDSIHDIRREKRKQEDPEHLRRQLVELRELVESARPGRHES